MNDDQSIDHVVLLWARAARSQGENVRVLQPGEQGGVGQFANDELFSHGDLNWQRFYVDGGAVVIVPHDPALDGLTGQRVRVERSSDGVLQVYILPVHEVATDARNAHPSEVDISGQRATVRDDTPPTPNPRHELEYVELESADDATTEIISLDQMPTINVRIEDMLKAPEHDETRDIRVNSALLQEFASEPTRDVRIDLELLRQLDASIPTSPHDADHTEPKIEIDEDDLIEISDADQTWDVSIDPEFLANLTRHKP